ncbi:SDR family NAD(P)-dependent oxidoreductase [Arenibaculum sp.]|jgi:NAD(P)-dependent dehydrogenase (short-subunit alcohol dehydrogenase family)|uniref:SDR family NAD(P)-dependent oxidoreductase n=1 Tax=Arenibaculum sp. TaxID=2865862 RepID=UPI002E0F24D9|nr:SDR family NAD(P)-dependent oxidoreductase [Arenibaculum sp.]
MDLKNQTAVVTGGSRGLGLGLVEALVDRGARVTVVARTAGDLESVSRRLGVATIAADVTDRAQARRIVSEVRPTILALNAGAPPEMGPLDELSWEAFSNTWENDVKAGLYWIQAALTTPLPRASRVLVGSSGASVGGSPMSGGYACAKRMLWFMANYANKLSSERGLGIRFQTVVPRQMIGGTGTGEAAASAYGAKLGIGVEQYLERFGAPMPPRRFGEHVVTLLTDPRYEDGLAFGVKGDTGISILEGAPA